MEFTQSEFFIETLVPSGELIVSRTNLRGNIIPTPTIPLLQFQAMRSMS